MKQNPVVQNQNASVESKGKTVNEAIANGLAQLNLSAEQVNVEVLSEGSRGILGLGAEDAVVRLTPIVNDAPADAGPVVESDTADSSPAEQPDAETAFDPALIHRAEEVLHDLLSAMALEGSITSRLGTDLV